MSDETDDPHGVSEAKGMIGCTAWLAGITLAVLFFAWMQNGQGVPVEDRPARATGSTQAEGRR